MRTKAFFEYGDQSPNPWDFALSRQNGRRGRQAAPPFRHHERRSGSIPGEPYPPSRLGHYSEEAGFAVEYKQISYCRRSLWYGINQVTLTARKWPVLK